MFNFNNTIIIGLLPYWLLIAILCVLSVVFYNKIIGAAGEFWCKWELKKLPIREYLLLSDVMIKDEKGTHQIDHIVISKFGIFVIEVKNYGGLIVGNEYKEMWAQYLGANKFYFRNPIYQNYSHIKALEKLLNLDESKFISIICNSNRSKLKIQSKSIVTQTDFINKEILKKQEVIVNQDINEIKSIIERNNIKDKEQRKKHIKDIKSKIKVNEIKENNMICPKCGNKLVKRVSKYGEFIGCSNYPKCKYIKK